MADLPPNMRSIVVLACLLCGACTTRLGTAPLLAPTVDAVGVKLLRPGVEGRSCRTRLVGVPLQAEPAGTLDGAVAEILAVDPEANVVTGAVVQERRIAAGVYDSRCIVVRGDVGRIVSTVTLPTGHEGHTGH